MLSNQTPHQTRLAPRRLAMVAEEKTLTEVPGGPERGLPVSVRRGGGYSPPAQAARRSAPVAFRGPCSPAGAGELRPARRRRRRELVRGARPRRKPLAAVRRAAARPGGPSPLLWAPPGSGEGRGAMRLSWLQRGSQRLCPEPGWLSRRGGRRLLFGRQTEEILMAVQTQHARLPHDLELNAVLLN